MLTTAVISIHVIVCIALVIVILLQQGKGAEVGAVFGGSSQTVFGASGAGNALTKATTALAVVFFATSIFLAYTSTRHATGSIFEGPLGGARSAVPQQPVQKSAPPAAIPAGGGATPAPAKK